MFQNNNNETVGSFSVNQKKNSSVNIGGIKKRDGRIEKTL